MTDTIAIVVDGQGNRRAVPGRVISRTGGVMAVTLLGRHGDEDDFSVTHIPTGWALRTDLPSERSAMKFARGLWRGLDKGEKKMLASEVPAVVEQLREHKAMRLFLRRIDYV